MMGSPCPPLVSHRESWPHTTFHGESIAPFRLWSRENLHELILKEPSFNMFKAQEVQEVKLIMSWLWVRTLVL